MQSGKGALADSGHLDEDPIEDECIGCSRMRIQLGALGSTRAFELETLSQHRHMIERLQDESYAQRSQLEEHRTNMEAMQRRLDQLEGVQHHPSKPGRSTGSLQE
jgi:septal ring factor EnvC (AmiA/AmiB activator)